MLNTIKNTGMIIGIAFSVFFISFVVFAWTSPPGTPPTCPAGEPGCETPLHTGTAGQSKTGGLLLNTGGASTGLIVEHGNVGIGTTSPGAKLDVKGQFIRQISRVQGYANDITNNGALVNRVLTFTKNRADTGIRVTWSDNFRVMNNATSCRWEIKFNGVSCSNPGALVLDKYEGATGSNRHDPSSFVGTCFGLAAGTYTIQGHTIGAVPGHSAGDCYTGWHNQLFSIEAEEVY